MVQKVTKPLTLGVDLGGTKANIALVDAVGKVLFSRKFLIPVSKEPDDVLKHLVTEMDNCFSQTGYKATAFGIGVAAQVDSDGFIFGSPNLGWQNFSLKHKLEKLIDLPVFITNDVRAATWAEWRYGFRKNVNDLAVIFVGTGIGGGAISGGKLLFGCNNSGGELGHVTLVYNGRKCRCPNRGCLEAYAGGWAIADRAQEAVRENREKGRFLVSLAGTIKNITAATVAQAYHEGDPLAELLVEQTGKYLAAGAVSVVNAFNPCCLVFGGGIIEGIPDLVEIVKKVLPSMALKSAVTNLKIEKSKLGNNAGAIGAAVLAQQLVPKMQ
ncbi:MAG: ROK family protein [Candidatus Bathyarchaeota archaeon]|nr:ROK family protein [Candidatus Bathyarchaeum tardum]WGM90304.1 MAG: ROK family protein [Candidatus Bathyarchaeum tardum]WNZ29610.1 MAG: ROK family protein [Candidatus Bathyarchaeota archaeon]